MLSICSACTQQFKLPLLIVTEKVSKEYTLPMSNEESKNARAL